MLLLLYSPAFRKRRCGQAKALQLQGNSGVYATVFAGCLPVSARAGLRRQSRESRSIERSPSTHRQSQFSRFRRSRASAGSTPSETAASSSVQSGSTAEAVRSAGLRLGGLAAAGGATTRVALRTSAGAAGAGAATSAGRSAGVRGTTLSVASLRPDRQPSSNTAKPGTRYRFMQTMILGRVALRYARCHPADRHRRHRVARAQPAVPTNRDQASRRHPTPFCWHKYRSVGILYGFPVVDFHDRNLAMPEETR